MHYFVHVDASSPINHRFGDEVAWWGRQAVDPVETSRKLWVSTRQIE